MGRVPSGAPLKIGVLSDAHGNPAGLDACLTFLHSVRVDQVIFLGDATGYMPEANRVLEELRRCDAHCLLGNHDAMLLGTVPLPGQLDEVYKLRQTRELMHEEHTNELAGRMPWLEKHIEGRRMLFVHGSPWDPLTGYVYPDSELDTFGLLAFDVVFMGHTHRPFIRRLNARTIINVGSCGLPRDRGDMASCAVYDTANGHCEIIRRRFDARAVAERYRDWIHDQVRQCLLRDSAQGMVGRIVER